MKKLEDMVQEEAIGIIRELALMLSDEVEATPDALIEEAFQIHKDRPKTPQYRLSIDLGEQGTASLHPSFDDAVEELKSIGQANPGILVQGVINKVS